MESGLDVYYNTLGRVWLASPDPLKSKTSRPVSIGRRMNLRAVVVIPGTSVCHKERCHVKVMAKECRFLRLDTYFLPRLSKYVLLDNLTEYLGMLPEEAREKLNEKILFVLLRKFGIRVD